MAVSYNKEIKALYIIMRVSMAAILNFGSGPTSDKFDRVISKAGMFENMGVDVGIAATSAVRGVGRQCYFRSYTCTQLLHLRDVIS